jgi:hypothetical protein
MDRIKSLKKTSRLNNETIGFIVIVSNYIKGEWIKKNLE